MISFCTECKAANASLDAVRVSCWNCGTRYAVGEDNVANVPVVASKAKVRL